MKRILTLAAAATAGLLVSISPLGERVAVAAPPSPGITICVLRICPNADLAVGVCATGQNANAARGKAIAQINQICASL